MSDLQIVKSLQEFLLNTPLYQLCELPDDLTIVSQIFGKSNRLRFDGHCPHCNKETTYTLTGTTQIPNGDPWDNVRKRVDFGQLTITCGRTDSHRVWYYFHLRAMKIQKIGQLPSLADIANSEIQEFRKGMSKVDGAEFYKAIGLAAHGAGVASFVYLRRVFERLVLARFNEFKEAQGWDEAEFKKKGMVEKIEFLKGHLPAFLIENARIYSILSVGVHELEEETCLAAFGFLKDSIIIILQDDKAKKEEIRLREKLKADIATFSAPAVATSD